MRIPMEDWLRGCVYHDGRHGEVTLPMEDWLRGCVYHDGRHGEVTLPTDKVLEIADYIQMTRTSQMDGCIELPPYTDDATQTDCGAKMRLE